MFLLDGLWLLEEASSVQMVNFHFNIYIYTQIYSYYRYFVLIVNRIFRYLYCYFTLLIPSVLTPPFIKTSFFPISSSDYLYPMIPLSAALPLQRSIFTFLDFNPHSIYSHLTIWRWEPQMRENMQYLSLNMTFSSSVCLPADLIILFFFSIAVLHTVYIPHFHYLVIR